MKTWQNSELAGLLCGGLVEQLCGKPAEQGLSGLQGWGLAVRDLVGLWSGGLACKAGA
jgi:hypothetical protein